MPIYAFASQNHRKKGKYLEIKEKSTNFERLN